MHNDQTTSRSSDQLAKNDRGHARGGLTLSHQEVLDSGVFWFCEPAPSDIMRSSEHRTSCLTVLTDVERL